MGRIKGVAVTLYERRETGRDGFGTPIYSEKPTIVEDVLICPATENAVVDDEGMSGRRAEYELCIPKGDTHEWENNRVDFFGQKWRVFGAALEYEEELVPLRWNRRVKVERIE